MKKALAIVLTIVLLISISGCSNNEATPGDGTAKSNSSTTIRVAHWYAEDHPQHLSLLKLKENLESKSDGYFVVEIYPNNQLGSEDVFDDSVSQGTVQMGVAGTLIQKWVPEIAFTEAPFLFNGWEDAQEIFNSEIGDYIVQDLPEKANMRCLAVTVNGFRQMSSNKSMNSMQELSHQRFRTPNIPHFIKMMDELGAVSIPMGMSEIFTAMETGVVDGQENPYPTIFTSSFYEVQDYVLESNHMFSPNFWIINEDFYKGLSEEHRTILDDVVKEAADYNWSISKEANDTAKKGIEDSGTVIIIPDDSFKKQMMDSMGPVYDDFFKKSVKSEEIFNMVRDYQSSN